MNWLSHLGVIDVVGLCGALLGIAAGFHLRGRSRLIAYIMMIQLFYLIAITAVDAPWFDYILAAPCDFLTIAILFSSGQSAFTRDLIIINFASLLLNAAGFFAYSNYMQPGAYNVAMLAVMAVQIIRFIWVSDDDRRHFRNDRGPVVVRCNYLQGRANRMEGNP